MFKLASPHFTCGWPVNVQKPVDGGKTEQAEITFQFELIENETDWLALTQQGDKAVMLQVVKGWDGLADHDGNELAFSSDNLALLSDISYVRTSVVSEYMRFRAGVGTKN